jgi:hypothetical protein
LCVEVVCKWPSIHPLTRVSAKPSRRGIIKDREALEVDGDDLWGGFIKRQTPLTLSVVVAGLTEVLSYDPLQRGKLGDGPLQSFQLQLGVRGDWRGGEQSRAEERVLG